MLKTATVKNQSRVKFMESHPNNIFVHLCAVEGAVSLRMDTIGVLSSAESSSVSLRGVSLSTIKSLTESMESCSPASQTPSPVLTLTTIAFTYHVTTHTFQVMASAPESFSESE